MTVAGIDVGEDYLDVAVIRRRRLRLARVDLRGVGEEYERDSTIERLAGMIGREIPELTAGAIALIDSPRWPRDLDCSCRTITFREGEIRGRMIDQQLRDAMRRIGGASMRLSMFPTPKLEYFRGQIAAASCKPHLRALGRGMFGEPSGEELCRGGTFTRFMIAGFATYRALERIGVECFESYPDLQFRLWNGGAGLPSKMKGKKAEASRARREAVVNLAERVEVEIGKITTLDAADAAIMALSVAAGQAGLGERVIIKDQSEGQFLFVMPSRLLSSRDDWKLRTRASKQEGVKA